MSNPVPPPHTPGRAYWQGVQQGLPFMLVVAPFGLLFGVAGSEAGLTLAQIMGFSTLVIAGASQFTALQMMNDNAPILLIIATALAVNLRLAMYSASLAPHLAHAKGWQKVLVAYALFDQNYAVTITDYEGHPWRTLRDKLAFYAGGATPMLPLWIIATLVGATVGQAIPPEFALDFAVPITFLAMIGPMLRTLAHVVAAFVSVAGALALAFLPSGIGLLIAAVLAMIAGVQTELWMKRQRG
jgi:predicted branched-subunit amino acid permease